MIVLYVLIVIVAFILGYLIGVGKGISACAIQVDDGLKKADEVVSEIKKDYEDRLIKLMASHAKVENLIKEIRNKPIEMEVVKEILAEERKKFLSSDAAQGMLKQMVDAVQPRINHLESEVKRLEEENRLLKEKPC